LRAGKNDRYPHMRRRTVAELKTQRTDASVNDYINAIEDEGRREDCRQLLKMMRRITGEEPAMWGTGMVGFGSYRYKYASGREGDWFVIGFASRKRDQIGRAHV